MTCSDGKVTTMVLKVDLACCQCYRKVKRLLCKFPQIRNQEYDEKQNTVTITVVCCSPEKIRDKLLYKGGKSIKGIDIKPPKKPEPAPGKTKPKPADSAPPAAEPEKPKSEPAPAAPADQKPPEKTQKDGSKNGSKNGSKPEQPPAGPPASKQAEPAPAAPAVASKQLEPEAQWVSGYPPRLLPQAFPVSVHWEGYGGPHHQSYGPGPAYGYPYGPPPYPPGCYGNRCDYFSEENPSTCSIM